MIAALIDQESTFDAKVRSSANAWGLMQIVPATGRRLARIARHHPVQHADADQPRNQHPARHALFLEAGGAVRRHATTRWPATTPARAASSAGGRSGPGLDQDEFIDDIPFPETQNYVKRILGHRRRLPDAVRQGRRPPDPGGRSGSGSRADHADDQAASCGPKAAAAPAKKGTAKAARREEGAGQEDAVEEGTAKKPSPKH